MKTKYTVTLILPRDRTILESKYSEAMVEVVSDMLSQDELGYLISEIKKKKNVF